MDELLDAISALVGLISSDKVGAVAARIRATDASKASALLTMLGTPVARSVVEQLVAAWTKTKITPDELASMLVASSHVYNKTLSGQSIELVWTGPTTPFVSARRTEQALLEVINSAQHSLFITSVKTKNNSDPIKTFLQRCWNTSAVIIDVSFFI
jgi:phosphatidylserine/phosphatidylglycerophosphate/cardiolipin synthase-like enzyme